jgi:5-methylcytosine-specific restriction endonuclease McrA
LGGKGSGGTKKWSVQLIKEELVNIGDGTATLVSTDYINTKIPLVFLCSCGREFKRCWNYMTTEKYTKSHKCNHCNNTVKWDIDLINEELERIGDTICLSTTYKHNKIPLKFRCGCGVEFERKWNVMRLGKDGHKCRFCNKRISWNLDLVKEKLIKMGIDIECISESYDSATGMLEFKCKCERKFKRIWSGILRGTYYCGFCLGKVSWNKELISEFVSNNSECEVIDIQEDGNLSELSLRCECGEEFFTNFGQFKNSNKRQCNTCGYKKYSGENHHLYNPNKTDEERFKDRYQLYGKSMAALRKEIFKRDNYTCKCCSKYGGDLNAHHLDGWHWATDKRLDPNNLVTLCEDCHKKFHHRYTSFNNTKEQFEQFLSLKEYLLID